MKKKIQKRCRKYKYRHTIGFLIDKNARRGIQVRVTERNKEQIKEFKDCFLSTWKWSNYYIKEEKSTIISIKEIDL